MAHQIKVLTRKLRDQARLSSGDSGGGGSGAGGGSSKGPEARLGAVSENGGKVWHGRVLPAGRCPRLQRPLVCSCVVPMSQLATIAG